MNEEVIIKAKGVKKHFPIGGFLFSSKYIKAVDDISLEIRKGDIFALVGETGSGKSTLGRLLIRLYKPDAGEISFFGADITKLSGKELRDFRKKAQMVFQDPFSSLDPKMTVEKIVSEGLDIHRIGKRKERRARVREILETVGIDPRDANRYPNEFSGGQRQRIAIARALILEPIFLVADEPTSSLDVSVRAQILELMESLKERFLLTILFITHDLSTVLSFCDKIAVMYLGKIVEMGKVKDVSENPMHPYTRVLLKSIPQISLAGTRKFEIFEGEPPSPLSPPPGCKFNPRCTFVREECKILEPELKKVNGREVSCHFAGKI